jgi:hypothetical protein
MTDPRTAEVLYRLDQASGRRTGHPRIVDRWLRALGLMMLGFAVPDAIVGFAMSDALALTTSAALICIAVVARDVANWRRQGLTPMTLYAFAGILRSVANTIAVLNQDTSSRSTYFLYAVDAHLELAMKVEWMGLVLPIIAFYGMLHTSAGRSVCSFAPPVNGTFRLSRLLPVALGGAALGMILNIAGILPSLGTLNSLVFFLPHLAAFTLAHVGIRRAWPKAVWLALAIAVAESGRALLFAYLRSDVVSPIFAYAVGVLVGARSLRAMRSVFLLPVYGMSAVAVIYFAAFAEVRGQSGGLERLESVAEVQATQQQYDVPTRHNLMTRLSSINQLTQVARVVEEDGYLNGETLEYLAYAWIPRFLWSEKPTIAKGAWFALRIGQARVYEGRITNSVNMTVPGELYLNYGWLGLMLGTCAFGAFLAVLWSAAGALRDDANILGNAFAYYLLWVGFGGGADLQIVVTLVANYALFLLVSIALPHTRPTSSRSAVARSRPSMVGTTQ